ncbi:DegV family protein [Thermobrachium celere]|uniref:DegV family protein n=1 Tax=Thermobrachium celere DSM 8682 TaxID=941824 RepID=R7RRK5_9CLOT|nr:DegV family protein [Thermobrachium celere]GFR35507.1 DegV family protein [Thermobrachium celere]CDF58674.1 DegV family protein [Thermobrachium celere DSM 8682]
MNKIAIVTDSTSDIPKELVNKYNIRVVPLTVSYKDKLYYDGVDLKIDELLEMLDEGEELPKTSQINPARFSQEYKKLLDEGYKIISIHISSNLSGTYQSALIAKDMLETDDIYVVDSRSVSFGTGMLALKAAKMIEEGKEVEEIYNTLNDLAQRSRVAFILDKLDYLKKGGRLSGAQAAIGTLLNIKPIIYINEGRLEILDKTRGMKKGLSRMIKYIQDEGFDKSEYFAVGTVRDYDNLAEFKTMVKEELGIQEMLEAEVGTVVATYSGPGVVGVWFYVNK